MKITVNDILVFAIIIISVILCILIMTNVLTDWYWTYIANFLAGMAAGVAYVYIADFVIYNSKEPIQPHFILGDERHHAVVREDSKALPVGYRELHKFGENDQLGEYKLVNGAQFGEPDQPGQPGQLNNQYNEGINELPLALINSNDLPLDLEPTSDYERQNCGDTFYNFIKSEIYDYIINGEKTIDKEQSVEARKRRSSSMIRNRLYERIETNICDYYIIDNISLYKDRKTPVKNYLSTYTAIDYIKNVVSEDYFNKYTSTIKNVLVPNLNKIMLRLNTFLNRLNAPTSMGVEQYVRQLVKNVGRADKIILIMAAMGYAATKVADLYQRNTYTGFPPDKYTIKNYVDSICNILDGRNL